MHLTDALASQDRTSYWTNSEDNGAVLTEARLADGTWLSATQWMDHRGEVFTRAGAPVGRSRGGQYLRRLRRLSSARRDVGRGVAR